MFAAPKPRPAVRPAPTVQPRHRDEVIDDVEVVEDVEVIDDVEVVDEVEVVDDDAPPRRRSGPLPRGKPVNAGIEVVDDDEEEDDDDEPRRTFKPKRKKRSNSGLIVVLVSIGAVVLLGGSGAVIWWLLRGGGADDPMAYVPADSQFVLNVDCDALLKSSYGARIEQMLDSPAVGAEFTKYKQDSKARNRDLFYRLVVAGHGGKITEILKSVVSFDEAKFAATLDNPTKETIDGKSVYRLKPGSAAGISPADPGVVAFPTRTVVVNSNLPNAEFESLLRSKGPALTGDLATLVNKCAKATFYVAGVPDTAARQRLARSLPLSGQSSKFLGAIQAAKGMCLWATLGTADIELKAGILMPDAATAQKAATDLQAEATKQGPAISLAITVIPGVPASVKAMIQEIVNRWKFAGDGNMTVVTTKISGMTIDNVIAELSALAATMPKRPTVAPGGLPNRGGRGSRGGRGGPGR
jgi:hypothetical protein